METQLQAVTKHKAEHMSLQSAILAGVCIAFGASLAAACGGDFTTTNTGLQRLVVGIYGFPFGLYACVIVNGSLFTSNIMGATSSWIDKEVCRWTLLKLLVFSYIGNFIGSILWACICFYAHTLPHYATFIEHKTNYDYNIVFFQGILCNLLVCLAVYCSYASKEPGGKFFTIIGPIAGFVSLSGQHCVANQFYLMLGIMYGYISFHTFITNLALATVGNLVGGIMLTLLIKKEIVFSKVLPM
jgi:nitrite transporter NirC